MQHWAFDLRLHTPAQSDELLYVESVFRRARAEFDAYSSYSKRGLPIPLELILLLGDSLKIQRPNHLTETTEKGTVHEKRKA